MTDFTTEQMLPVTFSVVDGRGRPKPVDGTPVLAVSDPTIASVDTPVQSGDSWSFNIIALTPGDARVTVTADADISPEVQDVVGFLDFTVTLDPRTAARTIALTPGAAVDQTI